MRCLRGDASRTTLPRHTSRLRSAARSSRAGGTMKYVRQFVSAVVRALGYSLVRVLVRR